MMDLDRYLVGLYKESKKKVETGRTESGTYAWDAASDAWAAVRTSAKMLEHACDSEAPNHIPKFIAQLGSELQHALSITGNAVGGLSKRKLASRARRKRIYGL